MPIRPFSPLRATHAGVAAVAWFALLLQLDLSIHQSLATGGGVAHGIWMYLAFFTILTNLLVALVLSLPIVAPASRAGRFCARPATLAGAAANIALVSIAYNLLLRDLWHPRGLQLVADALLHDVVPVAVVVLALFGARQPLSAPLAERMRWGLWPIAYFGYAMARGAATGFYAYPFIHVGQLGYFRVLLNAIGIFAGFLLITLALFVVERLPGVAWRARTPSKAQ